MAGQHPAGTRHWAREIGRLGHEVRLIPSAPRGRNLLTKAETVTIAAIEAGVPSLVEARDLIAEFHVMIRRKAEEALTIPKDLLASNGASTDANSYVIDIPVIIFRLMFAITAASFKPEVSAGVPPGSPVPASRTIVRKSPRAEFRRSPSPPSVPASSRCRRGSVRSARRR